MSVSPVSGVEEQVVVGVQQTAVFAHKHLVFYEVAVVQAVQLMQQHRVQLSAGPIQQQRGRMKPSAERQQQRGESGGQLTSLCSRAGRKNKILQIYSAYDFSYALDRSGFGKPFKKIIILATGRHRFDNINFFVRIDF